MIHILLSALLISSSPSASSTAAPTPRQRWIVDYEPNACLLLRERFGDAGGLVIKSRPYETEHELRFLLPRRGQPGDYFGKGTLSVPASRPEESEWLTVEERASSADRIIRTSISKKQLALATKQPTLGVTIDGQQEQQVRIPGLSKALLVVEQCERGLAAKWGVPKSWAIDPSAIADPRGLFRSKDDPASLLNAGLQGDVILLLKVESSGRVSECRSLETSNKTFEGVACAVLRKRAKYNAATDASGKAVSAYVVLPPIRFRIAN